MGMMIGTAIVGLPLSCLAAWFLTRGFGGVRILRGCVKI